MNRRTAVVMLSALGLSIAAGAVIAQQRAPLVAVLLHGKQSALGGRLDALREGLRDLGYVEGGNLRMEVRWSEGQADRLSAMARELVALRPDVVVGQTVLAAQALHRETKTIPIVIAGGAGAKRLGLIASLARPGGNVTGAINLLDELSDKQVQLVREIVPHAKRVAVLSSGRSAAEPEARAGTHAAAKAYAIELIEIVADTPAKLSQVIERCRQERCEALVVLVDPVLQNIRPEVVAVAAKLRIPAAYPSLEYASDGGLLTYSVNLLHLIRRAAGYVDKILKGARPQDLPVEQPTKFELVVNLKTAKALGIEVPQTILLQATKVIE